MACNQTVLSSQLSTPLSAKQLRHSIRQQRRTLSEQQQRQASQQISQKLYAHQRVAKASCVSLFMAFDGEIDLTPLITRLWSHRIDVCLPLLHPFSAGNLLFVRYQPETELKPHRYGLSQPVLDVRQVVPVREIDVILTPLVAFDSSGNRLGMGGGYYDRTLQQWQSKGPYPIGVAHDCQQVPALTPQLWDIPLPEIITPTQHITTLVGRG
ncbi:MAG: 5-formyltetrahydrofolate cyclo-ligase [Enterobacteriaceae bacterium]